MKTTHCAALLTFVCVGLLSPAAWAATVTYRMAIDGNYATTQSFLSVGVHTLRVEALVTDNDILGMFPAGLFQSSFNLATNNGGFTFRDEDIGFLGTGSGNGTWDSVAFIPPFDGRFQGSTAVNGGPTVTEETHFVNPSNYNDKFADIGANVYSVVAQGQFVFSGGPHPSSLTLTSSPAITLVAEFDGTSQIVSVNPDVVNGATIFFPFIDPFPVVIPDGGQRGIAPRPGRIFSQQFNELDGGNTNSDWEVVSFTGPTSPAGYGIDANGLFTWDTTGVPAGSDQVYSLIVRATNEFGISDTGFITIVMPEPTACGLAAFAIAFAAFAPRRRAS